MGEGRHKTSSVTLNLDRFGCSRFFGSCTDYKGHSSVDMAMGYLMVLRHHGHLGDILDELIPDPSSADRVHRQLAEMDIGGIQQWIAETTALRAFPPAVDARAFTELRVKLKPALAAVRSEMEAMGRLQSALRSFGLLIEADRDLAAGFAPGHFDASSPLSPEHLARFRSAGDFGPSADSAVAAARDLVYQSAVSHALDGDLNSGHLWTLTVPTGAAKTLAAIGWGAKRREARVQAGMPRRSIVYALPFTSIIDQNAAVLRKLWDCETVDESMLSVHHHLAEPGDIAKSGEESLANIWVEGWRSDVICTTLVQVVNALFHGTCADARRLNQLAGSILILDEVQAFRAELWPVLRTAIESLSRKFGTDVLLVTATQPALFSEGSSTEIGPGQFPEAIRRSFDRYDLRIDIGNPLSLPELQQRVAGAVSSSSCALCLAVLNTVKEALDLHELLATGSDILGHRLFHLSTNLRPKDRQAILAQIRACETNCILVATQVVEAGVDLSFDFVFRARGSA